MDRAGGGLQLTADQLDDGGLAGTGRPHQKAKFAVLDLHAHAVEGGGAMTVGFYDIGKFYHLHLSPLKIGLRKAFDRNVTEL